MCFCRYHDGLSQVRYEHPYHVIAPKKISVPKTQKPQGFSLKGTKIDQWVKAGTGQTKIRSSNKVIGILLFEIYLTYVKQLL